MADENAGHLSVTEKVGYSLGDFASNFYWRVFDTFILIFYTDVFGIPAASAATLLLVTRIWDAVNDPVMGILADRTQTRWGRYRPWLIWMILPLVAAGVLTFFTPDLPTGGKVVYAYVTYILMMMTYTAINIPYSALMGVISPNTQERTSVSQFRFVGAFTGGIVVQSSTLWLVKWLGEWSGGGVEAGWPLTMLVYGIIAGFAFAITFATTQERVEPIQEEPNLRADIADVLRNEAIGYLIVIGTVVLTNAVIRGSATIYYLKYYLAVHEMNLFGYAISDMETLTAVFLTAGGVANLLGVLATTTLTNRLGKRSTYIICMTSGAALTLSLFLFPGDWLNTVFVINFLGGLAVGPTAPIMFAMYADVADYGEWKTGRRTTGLVFSGAMLSTKFGAAIGQGSAGYLLYLYGYEPNVAQQTESALTGILLSVSVVPAVLMMIGVAAMVLYPLSDVRMKEIGADLEARRQKTAAA
ncbi:MAG: MFS transporter [Myxococcota bacterium]